MGGIGDIHIHHEQIPYAKARAIEQKMIEDKDTLKGIRGEPVSPNNRGNKNNSFDKNRTDPNGLRYKEEYDKL